MEQKKKSLSKEDIQALLENAEKGDCIAQFELGLSYIERIGVPQSDVKAAKWFRLSATQGYAEAQCFYGVCFFRGIGVPQSYEEAVKWYRLAAEQGLSYAQRELGDCYRKGEGVPQSYEEAAKWYRLAAEQGNAEAQARLRTLRTIKMAHKVSIVSFICLALSLYILMEADGGTFFRWTFWISVFIFCIAAYNDPGTKKILNIFGNISNAISGR